MKADTVIILALILSILLVCVYIGKSITKPLSDFKSAWSEGVRKIKGGTSNFTSTTENKTTNFTIGWSKSFGKIKNFLGWKSSFIIEEPLLETMYELDNFVFTANDTDNEYLAQLIILTEKTRVYDVSFYDVNLLQDIVRDYDKIIVSDRLMKMIDTLSENTQINIYSNSYDAELTFAKPTPETDILYRLTITKNEVINESCFDATG
jgi:hypothetical protein